MKQDLEWFKTQRVRTAFRGILVGLCFPLLASIVSVITTGQPLNLQSIREVQRSQAALWIIDTAPLFFGIFGYFIGARQECRIQEGKGRGFAACNRRAGCRIRVSECAPCFHR